MAEIAIRPLVAADALAWRALRLEMLEHDPQGFFADIDQARALTDEDWRRAIPTLPDVILGVFEGETLVGSCGFRVEILPKLAHKGQMWGVYVSSAFRRRGHALALVRATVEHARKHVDVLLTGASRAGAPIYKQAGFESYGIERDAYRVNGVSLDNELLAFRFAEA